ncbi:MAG: DUF687 family protein, partial [Silvanigrellaceae bacterium]|nr:DUF687 family protein [Silvanigrellaceae bacterium]
LSFSAGINLYAYVNNNPWRYFDRRGLSAEEYRSIYFYDDFEKIVGPMNRSCTFDLDVPNKECTGIGFINGIRTNKDECRSMGYYISDLVGCRNIECVHNASHGFLNDIYECILGLQGIATPPVRELHNNWNEYINNNSSEFNYLQICTSQGAIHVNNGLLSFPEELRKRILVLAISPAVYIDPNLCGGVYHYRSKSWRDIIPYRDQKGALRSHGTIRELNSHPKAPLHDHTILSPTFRDPIILHTDTFLRSGRKNI